MWFPQNTLQTIANPANTRTLEIDFIPPSVDLGGGRLGMTMLPGRKGGDANWDRDVEQDVRALKEAGTEILVTLIEPHEFAEAGVSSLFPIVAREGIASVWFPIPDHGVPNPVEPFDGVLRYLLERLDQARNVTLHCKAGHGRTGLVAACLLLRHGLESDPVIKLVQGTREGTLSNDFQIDFVKTYERFIYPDRQPCAPENPNPPKTEGRGWIL